MEKEKTTRTEFYLNSDIAAQAKEGKIVIMPIIEKYVYDTINISLYTYNSFRPATQSLAWWCQRGDQSG
jgi:hypothetical protein